MKAAIGQIYTLNSALCLLPLLSWLILWSTAAHAVTGKDRISFYVDVFNRFPWQRLAWEQFFLFFTREFALHAS